MTGAGQGVGRQIALHFAANHAKGVVVNDYHLERAEAVAKEINQQGGNAIPIQADVTDYTSVEKMIQASIDYFGKSVDILVNNAGNAGANPDSVQMGVPFWESDPKTWDGWIGVNLMGVLNCSRAAIPEMIQQGNGGRIITVISDAGRVGEPHLPVYSAAKAGASGLMRALAKSLGRYNITANSVAIAATMTPRLEGRMDDEERMRKVLKNYVIRRLGQPSDVANMVLFLASEASGWMTGQTYPVNGGYSFNQ
nr:SDR family oxidoreductase [Bacillus dakarensis]